MEDTAVDSDSSSNHSSRDTPSQRSSETSDHTMSTPVIDSSDPLFLHASDHPGMTLVSKALDGTNYVMWKRSMMVSLGAKNKLGFIKGTI